MADIIRAVAFVGVILTFGCGQEAKTRATTGGLMGAGSGVALGIASGGIAPMIGAVVGGGAGAAGGAATAKRLQPNHQPPRGVRQPIINSHGYYRVFC
jgi:hypothetical protein